MTAHTGYRSITTGEHTLAFALEEEELVFPRVTLPGPFVDWVVEGRKAMYDLLEGRAHAPFFGSHLPVVVTSSRNSAFPFNTGNKGVGLLPVPEKMDDYCDLYQETFRRAREEPWEERLKSRLDAVRRFITSEDISNEALVSLEIFEKTTFSNLADYPIATLHYTGDGPIYRSFQINAVVQIVPPEHPVYRFAFLSRQLFEYDSFHITQTMFPYAYIFYPTEVRDKTPFPRREDSPAPARPAVWSEMTLIWDDVVLEQLIRAPTAIQRFIIKVTEKFARERGETSVGTEMFEAVRANYLRGKGHGDGHGPSQRN